VPVPRSDKHPNGFVLLWASPNLALDLLGGLPRRVRAQKGYLKGPEGVKWSYYEHPTLGYKVRTVEELLDGKNLDFMRLSGETMETFNNKVDAKVRRAVRALKDELDLKDSEVVPLPVLFRNLGASIGRSTTWYAEALTPGVVNLSSMGEVSLVPDPFIPVFREYVVKTLQEAGQKKPIFIDDWPIYHKGMGEVHCGSNMRRTPFPKEWLWKQ